MSWEFGESNVFQNMPKWEPNVQPIIPCHVQDSLQHDLVLVNFSSSVFVHVLCHVTFQSTKCTGGPHAHIAARSGSHLARDVTSPLPPLHGEASLMVWGSVCTRAQRSHQQWVNYITSHEISWAVWVSCLLTTSAINTWHGTRRLFAMRLNVEAATGRISNSSSEALSKKAIAQTGWDLWGFGATPLFQTNLLSRLRTRKSCVAGPSGETWIIMVHHHVYMLMRMLMFIYIYITFLAWRDRDRDDIRLMKAAHRRCNAPRYQRWRRANLYGPNSQVMRHCSHKCCRSQSMCMHVYFKIEHAHTHIYILHSLEHHICLLVAIRYSEN